MFRARLVNTINQRLQDALTTQKHLKVFYKQKIMLNQIKYQLKINSGVRELLVQSSQGRWDKTALSSKLLWSGAHPDCYLGIG